MASDKGILYGLGVGPGDPDLITLKAIKILQQVDVVYAAGSSKNDYSLAVSIAKPHIPENTPVKLLRFPMTSDKNEKKKAWENHARSIIHEMEQGRHIAFITLGDAMTYSTYGYLMKTVLRLAPRLPVVSVPGITSYQAAAAGLNRPLVEGEESLLLVSGTRGGHRFRRCSACAENVIFLKAYKNITDINDALDEAGCLDTSVAVSNCSLPEETITSDLRTLVLTHQKAKNGQTQK
jgi:precorrin-2/cobalt-factor-2 C20-methyltransferase